jgi:hypothetical protein
LQLLSEIRESTIGTQYLQLGITSLDQILEIIRRPQIPPPRPAWQSPQASSADGEDYYHDPNTPSRFYLWTTKQGEKQPAKTIQLTSANPAAGKTNLLYHLSSFSILCRSSGGNEATIVWLDTDGRFSSLRLAQLYARMLRSHSPQSSKADLEVHVKDGLSHVHVFRPQSSSQLLATLKNLSNYLLSRDQRHSQQRPLGLVILDSATAFHWADRADAEVARLSDPRATTPPSTTSQAITHLKELEMIFNCTIIFTTDASLQRKNRPRPESIARTVADSPLPPPNEHAFQDPWTNFAALTLDVHRVAVPQFTPTMTIAECRRDQPRRIEAVQRGRHRAQAVWWSSNERDEVREEIRKSQGGEGFGFRITEQGVEIEPASSV